jgi:hypothetical protein
MHIGVDATWAHAKTHTRAHNGAHHDAHSEPILWFPANIWIQCGLCLGPICLLNGPYTEFVKQHTHGIIHTWYIIRYVQNKANTKHDWHTTDKLQTRN